MQLRSLLVRFATQPKKVTKEVYFRICEELGQEPDPTKMPIELSDLPVDVQVAFFMLSLLTDTYDYMGGYWMGKSWTDLPMIFELHGVDDQRSMFYFMKLIESVDLELIADRRKKESEKANTKPGGGKKYTHKVSG